MPTNMRGRGGSRPVSNRFDTYSYVTSNWGRTGTGGKRNSGTRTKRSGSTNNSSKYKSVSTNFVGKINSFKTLYNQTQGPASFARPTPTTLNTFANWINRGAVIQTCTAAQVARWARSKNKNFNTRTPSTTACKTVLNAKFGKATIKAVARTKNGMFMVATTPTCNGRPFCFPQ
jgi:hypothetical protein